MSAPSVVMRVTKSRMDCPALPSLHDRSKPAPSDLSRAESTEVVKWNGA